MVKQDGKSLQVVHDLQRLNFFTIQDAGQPPCVDKFLESMAGHACYRLVDVMGGVVTKSGHPGPDAEKFKTFYGSFI